MDFYCIFQVLLQYIFLSDIRNYMAYVPAEGCVFISLIA